jgi:5-methylcytosine-specific restriction endonuclease McrA
MPIGKNMIETKNNKCELCGTDIDEMNFHHLIPRTLDRKLFYKFK